MCMRESLCCSNSISTDSVCYSFYKIGKKKRLNDDSQEQIDNQVDNQPNEMSCSNPITMNALYTTVTAPALHSGSQDTLYI